MRNLDFLYSFQSFKGITSSADILHASICFIVYQLAAAFIIFWEHIIVYTSFSYNNRQHCFYGGRVEERRGEGWWRQESNYISNEY